MLLWGCAGMPQRPDPPTVAQVVQMSKDKTDPAAIVKRMQDADAVYRLSASQLAQLREQGVSDVVIDYMQSTWLNAVRREEADRYWMYDMWPPAMGFYGPGLMYGPRGRYYSPWRPVF
jgi:hypothetical protein